MDWSAKPEMYRPIQEAGQLVMDAVNVGLSSMHKAPEEELKESVLGFIKKYGFLGFTFVTSFLYYMDYDKIDEQTRSLYCQGLSVFGGISPTYRIALEKDSPIIVWDFHSLLVMLQMCFSFMLTDKDSDMRLCKHCNKAFIASRKGNEFYSQRCKNQFNVYKRRAIVQSLIKHR